MLKCFGFKKIDGQIPAGNRSSHGGLNESGVSYKPPHPQTHQQQQQQPANNGSFVETVRDRSGERMPPAGHPSTMSQDLRPSQLPGKPMDRRSNLSQHNIASRPPPPQSSVERNNSYTASSINVSNAPIVQSSQMM